MMKEIDEMGGDKIGRVFLQFPLRQPVHHVASDARW